MPLLGENTDFGGAAYNNVRTGFRLHSCFIIDDKPSTALSRLDVFPSPGVLAIPPGRSGVKSESRISTNHLLHFLLVHLFIAHL